MFLRLLIGPTQSDVHRRQQTSRCINVGSTLVHRLRRWTNVKRLVSTGFMWPDHVDIGRSVCVNTWTAVFCIKVTAGLVFMLCPDAMLFQCWPTLHQRLVPAV